MASQLSRRAPATSAAACLVSSGIGYVEAAGAEPVCAGGDGAAGGGAAGGGAAGGGAGGGGQTTAPSVTAWPLARGGGTACSRRLLRKQLSCHLDASTVDDLETVVSELATNALCHTDGPCELRIVTRADVPVLCEIADVGNQVELIAERLAAATDTGPEPPAVNGSADSVAGAVAGADLDVADVPERGLGLGIVAAFTGGRCGVHRTRLHCSGLEGKSVWFELTAPSTSRLPP